MRETRFMMFCLLHSWIQLHVLAEQFICVKLLACLLVVDHQSQEEAEVFGLSRSDRKQTETKPHTEILANRKGRPACGGTLQDGPNAVLARQK